MTDRNLCNQAGVMKSPEKCLRAVLGAFALFGYLLSFRRKNSVELYGSYINMIGNTVEGVGNDISL